MIRYFRIVKRKEIGDTHLSPMTYKKLKELNYGPEDWKDWSQEYANKVVGQGVPSENNPSTHRQSQTLPRITNARKQRDLIQSKIPKDVNGTYDYYTGKPVDFSGKRRYQFSFQTTSGEDKTSDRYLTDEQYDDIINSIFNDINSKPYVGVFAGCPEISFACKSFKTAVEYATKYNQYSIWNWKIGAEYIIDMYDSKYNKIKE